MDSFGNQATLLGTVQDVSGTSVSVTLNGNQLSGLSFVNGQGYRIGQLGSFVKIPVGYIELFGIVSQVGASAVPEALAATMPNGHRWIKIQLIGEGYKGGKFQRGISQYPTIDDEVHLVSENDLASIYGRRAAQNHLVKVGHIAGSESIDALVDINKLVTRHSAIVGTTGSGKSTTVAGLLTALSDLNRFPSARIVVLDIHGEYAKALANRANVYKISPDPRNENEKSLQIPFWAMNFEELLGVTFGSLPADGKARNVIMEKIIQLKSDTLAAYPQPGITQENLSADSPIPFSINRLWYDLYCLEFGTYRSDGGRTPTQANWAFEQDQHGNDLTGDAERGIPPKFRKPKNVQGDPEKINWLPDVLNIRPQLDSLGAKLRISRFDFVLRPGRWRPQNDGQVEADLAELMKGWLGNGRPVTILDLSGVPTALMNDVIGILLRVLYDALFWARNLSQGGRERPLLVVMEEAHTYLNDNFHGPASLIVQRIVKEGRKYGIGAMIVSQRPAEINQTILSQCGTFFALRLSNATDRSHITSALTDNLEGLTNMLPILRTGEAIILGEAVGLPMRTLIQAPPKDQRPDSQDPVVCDDLAPELSMIPGGWNIPMEVNPNYEEFALVWRQQNPRIHRQAEEEQQP
ncbi:ATP-binding protein [Ochrobactrum sp. MT180101]|nr:ATP-binding protein [Ochrobactrum sp. MT180101]